MQKKLYTFCPKLYKFYNSNVVKMTFELVKAHKRTLYSLYKIS